MTIYRVIYAHGTDEYGYNDGTEKAKYFLNKDAAEAFYKMGEYITRETRITTTFKDGTTSVGTLHAMYYEREKANARPWEKVELVERIENYYRIEKVETED